MDIFNRREITNFTVLAPFVIKLSYDDGSYKVHSNIVWSVNKNTDSTGMIHLFQDGAGGSIGFFGHYVSEETPLTMDGNEMTDIEDVLSFMLENVAE